MDRYGRRPNRRVKNFERGFVYWFFFFFFYYAYKRLSTNTCERFVWEGGDKKGEKELSDKETERLSK